ncbi:NUDIX domain-containing protein [Sandaracinus amylolyticus]|uniref:Nudix hydrolase domain-containing protein n=1 Tax=Sandaracinus amylolyticus TaxID=927083 RepID=A0A0F6YG03_9BACT|nr:NUDIX domain-containing protein [Sandaracinus amylolyticus]AKF04257.1 hypothetical protein DB32_001406 [Sandaracinus amylolyticus]
MGRETLGVVVARFQSPELHDGHRHLLDVVESRHPRLLVVLGTARTYVPTSKNPLDFATRREMVRGRYPLALVAELPDCRGDAMWSRALDAIVAEHAPAGDAVLYGSRDSFLRSYSGEHRCEEIDPIEDHTATALRLEAVTRPATTDDFRRGVIYAATTRPPVVYQTVDVAITDDRRRRVLFAKKREDAGALRFLGGFVLPGDDSLEAAARREAIAESGGLEIGDATYLGSTRVDDWRYRGGADRITTALFVAPYLLGRATGADDVDENEWVSELDVTSGAIAARLVPEHRRLGEMLAAHLRARR